MAVPEMAILRADISASVPPLAVTFIFPSMVAFCPEILASMRADWVSPSLVSSFIAPVLSAVHLAFDDWDMSPVLVMVSLPLASWVLSCDDLTRTVSASTSNDLTFTVILSCTWVMVLVS
ncbi:MAG: hypothetical protein QM820_09005 [Minicystis sp.]